MNRIEITQVTFEGFKTIIKDILADDIPELLRAHLKPQDEEVLLTREEVAEILRISIPTLYSYTRQGILKTYRLDSRVLYKKSEVLHFFDKKNPDYLFGKYFLI